MPTSIPRLSCLFILFVASITAPAELHARAATPEPAPSFLADMLAIVLPLVLVMAGLVLVLRLARKRLGITGQDAPVSILQILPVGPRERVVLLRTRAERVIAIGVCPTSVSHIADLTAEDVGPAPREAVDEPESLPNARHRFEALLANVARKAGPSGDPRPRR